MSDALWDGPRFRTFNVVDDFNREALTIAIDFNLLAQRVVRELDQIAALRGYPLKLRTDNGPEFIAVDLADWAEQHGVTLEFIKPGKPMQQGSIAVTAKRCSTCSCFRAWKKFVNNRKSGSRSTTKSGHITLWEI